MNRAMYRIFQFGVAGVVFAACLLLRDGAPDRNSQSLVSSANAVIGRPLTPVSYAGVARRTTRRAVVAGAAVGAVGAAVAAPVVVAPVPTCVQAVDVYGRIYLRCP